MGNTISTRSKTMQPKAVLKNSADEAKTSRIAKRLAQHRHWMRVMMEGQATPDLRYRKSKL